MQKFFFILEKAQIPKAITNSSKSKNKPSERLDILHQCLMSILDSPLNKEKDIEIYVLPENNNSIIKVSNQMKIPRTLERFNGLLKELNKKLKVKNDKNEVMMSFKKGPLDEILNSSVYKIGLSDEGNVLEKKIFEGKGDVAFFINCIAKGSDDNLKNKDGFYKVSNYPLSAFVVCVKVCTIIEDYLGVY